MHAMTAALSIIALAASGLLAGCSPVSSTSSQNSSSTPSCDSILGNVIQRHRTGDTAGTINSKMDWLSRNCSTEYDIATDYFSSATVPEDLRPQSCDFWSEYNIRPEAIALLREDGLCGEGRDGPQPDASWPEGGLGWDNAWDYAGTYQRVCGPLASMRNTYDGVFLNVGRDYPSPDRFTFIIWGIELNPIVDNATICASGEIYLYEGVAQIELGAPEQIEIWQ